VCIRAGHLPDRRRILTLTSTNEGSDNLIPRPVEVIQTDGVAQVYAARFAYVLVDEAQDLTRVQYDLVAPIGRGYRVFAGDKAQGIYAGL
jgi:superfamily I DNA/RNA helicase